MRYHFPVFLLFIFLASSLVSYSQNKHSKAADDAFTDQMYLQALQRYQKAYSKVKNNKAERERISFRMAECYRMMNNTKKSEVAYKRCIGSKYYTKEPRVYLYYADALKANGNYDEAIKQYEAYKEKVPGDPKGDIGIETCKLGKEWMANPSKYDVKWVKSLASKEDDFAPAFADRKYGSIIFTSDRGAAKGRDIDNWTGLGFSDLFYSRIDRKGEWSKPVLADEAGMLNSKANDGVGQFNPRFSAFYFTRCWNDPKKKNGCGICKVSRQGQTTWGEPEKIDLGGDSSYVFGHPTVSNDETIFFSAELPGGHGGKDIWMTKKKAKGGGYAKENLGPEINTTGDELFPFIRSDSILYFASNGLPGMGGLDLFRSVKTNGKWGKPENMRYPINSPADDFAIVFNLDEPEQGLFSSNRPGGKGKDDIYSFVVPPVYFTLEGTVTDDRTLQPVQGANIRIVGTNGRALEDNTDDKGFYSFNKNQISTNTTYEILVTKKDYFNEKGRETTVGLEKSKDITRNFILRPIPKKPVVLPDILYDLAKWDLKPQYQDSLQGLIETLDANETIIIELASHTDSRDSDERNDILSQKRAQSVVDYLISRGIDPDRLVAKGYGERVPRVLNKDITKEEFTFKAGTILTDSVINLMPNTLVKEAAHQMNRRTEFSILRNDFVPKTMIGKATPTKIEVVVNPEENNVPFTLTKEGYFVAECFINGSTMTFNYDPKEKEFYISPDYALKLLKDGLIEKTDFQGDVTKIIGEGIIADKAVFNIKEMRIGRNTVKDIQATVNRKIALIRLGEATLKKFGSFSVDDKLGLIIFE